MTLRVKKKKKSQIFWKFVVEVKRTDRNAPWGFSGALWWNSRFLRDLLGKFTIFYDFLIIYAFFHELLQRVVFLTNSLTTRSFYDIRVFPTIVWQNLRVSVIFWLNSRLSWSLYKIHGFLRFLDGIAFSPRFLHENLVFSAIPWWSLGFFGDHLLKLAMFINPNFRTDDQGLKIIETECILPFQGRHMFMKKKILSSKVTMATEFFLIMVIMKVKYKFSYFKINLFLNSGEIYSFQHFSIEVFCYWTAYFSEQNHSSPLVPNN